MDQEKSRVAKQTTPIVTVAQPSTPNFHFSFLPKVGVTDQNCSQTKLGGGNIEIKSNNGMNSSDHRNLYTRIAAVAAQNPESAGSAWTTASIGRW
jgi:hypothetical protein